MTVQLSPRRLALFLLAVGTVGCDQGTKALSATELHVRPLTFASGFFELRDTRNPDVAFSLFTRLGVPHPPGLLALLVVLGTLAVLLTWVVRARRGGLGAGEHAGHALVLAGAVGNGLDRLVRGQVVDFVKVGAWPVFNVADVAIVLGFGLLALASASRARRRAPLRARSDV